jgi:hypothetical protein
MAFSVMHRAPIQQETIRPPPVGSGPGDKPEEEDKRPRTRCGYLVPEAYACYESALGEVGPVASGKALHFAADLICSGGLDIWIRGAYSYAMQKINLSNPRIFVYLKQRIQELDKKASMLPQEAFYNNPDVQASVAETVLVLQLCPKHVKVTWPKIDENTRRPGWLRGVAGAPETRANRKVWSSESDSPTLYLVGNEFCKAIQDGVTERALFWIRWTLEEDTAVRKSTKGHGLSNKDRGPPQASPKSRTEAGHYMAALLNEIYKELAEKGLVRMVEEFQELQRLWKQGEPRMAARLRRDCLALMAMICCEVPRWRVPAAAPLVSDPIRLARAVAQSPSFFHEVLAYKPLKSILKPTMTKGTGGPRKSKKEPTEKEKKEMSMEEHFDAYDAVMEAYLNRSS